MNLLKLSLSAAALAFLIAGCNPNGYVSLDEKADVSSVCQPKSTAWIRYTMDESRFDISEAEPKDLLTDDELDELSDEEEQALFEERLDNLSPEEEQDLLEKKRLVTEVLILGQEVTPEDDTGGDCLYLAQFDYEGSILLDQGDFVLEDATPLESGGYVLENPPADGETYRGLWTMSVLYDFIRQPELGILSRNGAKRTEYPLPENQPIPSLPRAPETANTTVEREIEFYREGSRLSFTVDGETKWFEEFGPIAQSLDPTVDEELTNFARMANVGLLVSQVRVIGFGSKGMTNYRTAKNFGGLMGGNLNVGISVSIDFNADATLDYQEFSDVPGLTLHGAQLVKVSPKGNGNMGGGQLLSLARAKREPAFFNADLDYSDTTIKQGFGHSGDIPVTPTDGDELIIAVEDVLVVDFRSVMPPDEGN